MNRKKYKLKFKESKNLWALTGPHVSQENDNYHRLLSVAITTARNNNGELHVYEKDGNLKDIVKYYNIEAGGQHSLDVGSSRQLN